MSAGERETMAGFAEVTRGDVMSDPQQVDRPHTSDAPPPASTIDRPATIKWAVVGMGVGAVLAALSVLVAYLETIALNRATYEAFGGSGDFGGNEALMDRVLHAGVWLAVGIATVFAVVEIALWVTLAITNWHGYNPARIVATILGALDFLLTAAAVWTSIASDYTVAISVGYNIVDLVLTIAILLLLWLPVSTTFYRAKRLERGLRVVNAAAGTVRGL